jgi:hypothetical protein
MTKALQEKGKDAGLKIKHPKMKVANVYPDTVLTLLKETGIKLVQKCIYLGSEFNAYII